jgi:hypothetical protein
MVHSVVQENAALAGEKGVTLHAVTTEQPVRGTADASGIRRVLLILVANALKHTPADGTVIISVAAAAACLTLTVEGIAEAARCCTSSNASIVPIRLWQRRRLRTGSFHRAGNRAGPRQCHHGKEYARRRCTLLAFPEVMIFTAFHGVFRCGCYGLRKEIQVKQKFLAFLTVVAISSLAGAADKSLQVKDLPAAVQKTVQDTLKGAEIKNISKEVEKGATQYEVETMLAGKHRDFEVDAKGKLLVVEEEADIASIPAAAKTAIEKKVAGGKLGKVETVDKGDGVTLYEAAYTSKTGKKSGILVKADGTETKDQ